MYHVQVRQIMISDVVSIERSRPLSEAVSLMAEKGISFLVVSSGDNRPAGVITEMDVLKSMSKGRKGRATVADVMSSPVLTVNMEEKVLSALHYLVDHNIRHLVVVDRDGRTAGIVTLTNFLEHLGLEYFVDIKVVTDIMNRTPLTMDRGTKILDAVREMAKVKNDCIVVAEDGVPVGIFTGRDAVRLRELTDTVGEFMSHPVLTVSKETHILDAVSTMHREKIRHLPVVDGRNKITGLISQMEIARGIELKYAESLKGLISEQERELREAYALLEEKVKERTSDLMRSREELRALASRIQSVREEERREIARNIHDDLGQILTVFKFDLSWIARRLGKDQKLLTDKINRMSQLADEAIERVQKISSDLRPTMLDDLGIQEAMQWQAKEFRDTTGIKCSVSFDPDPFRLDGELSIEIFRIYQEALTNIARHSEATETNSTIAIKDGRLVFVVSDNGKGISVKKISDPGSIGLIGIRERIYPWGGDVDFKGVRGKGTVVTVTVPLGTKRNKI